jgi:hypothetical protein
MRSFPALIDVDFLQLVTRRNGGAHLVVILFLQAVKRPSTFPAERKRHDKRYPDVSQETARRSSGVY